MLKKNIYFSILLILFGSISSCYEQELRPIEEKDFPLKIVLDLTEGGAYESDDSYGLEISFDGGVDEITDENGNVIAGSPEGTRGPYHEDLVIEFMLKDAEGLTIGTDVSIEEIIYEIDECTEGSAAFTFNANTGTGIFTIPAGVEAVEIVFALDADAIDNDVVDVDERTFVMELTGIQNTTDNVILDINNEFEYTVLDDEAVFAEWILDHEDPAMLEAFLTLFGPLNEELTGLSATDVDEIKFEFEYEEVKILVVLVETEMEEECEEQEEVNLEIELEGEFEVEDGEIELVLENDEGDEFTYVGAYEIEQGSPNLLSITLEGEDEDGEGIAPETTLTLERDE